MFKICVVFIATLNVWEARYCHGLETSNTQKPHTSRNKEGDSTTLESYPYFISFLPLAFGSLLCGGTIISRTWVLSAGNCYWGDPFVFLHVGSVYTFPEYSQYIKTWYTMPYTHKNREIVVIPKYNILLLELKEELKFGENIGAISAIGDINDLQIGVIGTAIGIGVTYGRYGTEHELRKADLPVMNVTRCEELKGREMGHGQFCAGYDDGEENICWGTGNVGGPFVINNTLYGFGTDARFCTGNNTREPVIFNSAVLRNVKKWIRQTTGIETI